MSSGANELCPKHGGGGGGKEHKHFPAAKRCNTSGVGPGGGNKKEPKEIMKKRRERAICIDRVSRVIFPSTFILLNIIYWLVFSEIMAAIKSSALGVESYLG